MKYSLIYILSMITVGCFAQAPVINDVQPVNAGPNQKIVITGSGFSTTLTNNVVWFDHVKGTVTAATIYSLEVQVPPGARFSNVEVINITAGNNLSAKSRLKFLPSYGGKQFNEALATVAYTNNNSSNELFDVASSDLDLDGKADLVASQGGPTTTAIITDLIVYQNTSTGIGNINFTRYDKTSGNVALATALTVGAPTANVACGDLNGDGKPDIVASRGGNTRNEIFILKNTNTTVGTLAFAAQPKLILGTNTTAYAFRIQIRDLNGDGKPEIISSNALKDITVDNEIYVFPNQSSVSTISFGAPMKLTVTGASSTYGCDVQDVDGDGMADIVVNQFQDPNVYIFRNTSTGNISFAPVLKITAVGSFNNIIASDLNNDGLPDLVATATLENNIQIWLNQSTSGNISFAGSTTIATANGPWGVDLSDVDGDGDADIIVANKNASTLNVLRQDSPLQFTKLDIATPNYFSRNLRVGDYDGDGKPDIVYTSFPLSGLVYTINVLRNANCWNPVITAPSAMICSGQTVPLTTKPALGVTFDWKLGGVSQGVNANTFSATASGTYTVTETGTFDATCSNISADYVLAPNPNPFPTDPAIGNNVPCLGSTLNLSTAPVATATYAWTGPNSYTSTAQNPSITPVTALTGGLYTLKVTLSNGCSSNVVSKTLDVASVPVMPITASPSATGCAGATITLNLPSTAGFTYQWNKVGTGAIIGQTGQSLSLTSLSAASEGDYSATVTSISSTCSQETAKTTVRVFSAPSANFSTSTPSCKGIAIAFTDLSTKDSRGTLTYLWSFGDASTSTVQSPSHTYATANSFAPNLKVSYAEASTCTNNVTKPLTVNAPVVPTIQTTANPICSGDQTTLSITGSYTTIDWVGVTGTSSSVIITEPAKYKVNTVDANGCAWKDSLTIAAKPSISPFTITSFKARISFGDTVKLSATSGADSYLWSPGKTLTDSTIFNPVAKPQVTTLYNVVAKKAGSCDATGSITITVEIGGAVINPPILFSPNGDGINESWIIPEIDANTELQDWVMTIFDGHGSQVFQKKGYTSANAWDGTAAPEGVYYYVFSNSKSKPTTGSVLLVRQKGK